MNTQNQEDKTDKILYIIGSIVLTAASAVIIPVLIHKGTNIAYRLLYPKE
ncbi:MAG: hypothetical protein IJ642_08750 [Oscillospiraceae bacterium]|nr:hypothetical protein [Oscillospiraceae bacterium]